MLLKIQLKKVLGVVMAIVFGFDQHLGHLFKKNFGMTTLLICWVMSSPPCIRV